MFVSLELVFVSLCNRRITSWLANSGNVTCPAVFTNKSFFFYLHPAMPLMLRKPQLTQPVASSSKGSNLHSCCHLPLLSCCMLLPCIAGFLASLPLRLSWFSLLQEDEEFPWADLLASRRGFASSSREQWRPYSSCEPHIFIHVSEGGWLLEGNVAFSVFFSKLVLLSSLARRLLIDFFLCFMNEKDCLFSTLEV